MMASIRARMNASSRIERARAHTPDWIVDRTFDRGSDNSCTSRCASWSQTDVIHPLITTSSKSVFFRRWTLSRSSADIINSLAKLATVARNYRCRKRCKRSIVPSTMAVAIRRLIVLGIHQRLRWSTISSICVLFAMM